MKLLEAEKAIIPLVEKRFGDIFNNTELQGIIVNKGKSGQILELAIGLQNSSRNLDFEDGELKTNKCDRYGNPKETMFITQILSIIDELLQEKEFYSTHIYEKISNLLYVPICKDGNPADWMFLPIVHVELNSEKFKDLRIQLEKDYYSICRQLKAHINATGSIHTSNGQYMQIRSKDSKPYYPIYSNIYEKYVSNKNHAFYFQKDFMRYITSI